MLAAHGAHDLAVIGNVLIHFLKGHGVHIHAVVAGFDQLIGTMAGLAGTAVQQRIAERGYMAGGDPGLRVHDDGCIQTHIQSGFLHELFHPCLFHIVLKFHTQRAVVPAVGQAAVNLAAGVHKAAVFAKAYDHVQGFFAVFHFFLLTARLAAAPKLIMVFGAWHDLPPQKANIKDSIAHSLCPGNRQTIFSPVLCRPGGCFAQSFV